MIVLTQNDSYRCRFSFFIQLYTLHIAYSVVSVHFMTFICMALIICLRAKAQRTNNDVASSWHVSCDYVC